MAVNNITAIKKFFERADEIAPDGGRPLTMPELKALTAEERTQLGAMCAKELGVEIETKS